MKVLNLLGIIALALLLCVEATKRTEDHIEIAKSTGVPHLIKPVEPITVNIVNRHDLSTQEIRKLHFNELLARYYAGFSGEDFIPLKSYASAHNKNHKSVTYGQTYKGIPVIGAELKVMFDENNNILHSSGNIVPNIRLDEKPVLSKEEAQRYAKIQANKMTKPGIDGRKALPTDMKAVSSILKIYPSGMTSDTPVSPVLAWEVKMTSESVRSMDYTFLIEAVHGIVINAIPASKSALSMTVYDYPDSTALYEEGDDYPESNFDAMQFITAAEDYYNTLYSMFERESYDNNDAPLIGTVDYVYNGCPNAYWDGAGQTWFCPGLGRYDVAVHELGHALTSYTDELYYEYMSGALNEAWSDLIAETFSQFWNGSGYYPPRDSSRTCVTSSSQSKRWIVGDNCEMFNNSLRDMYNPECTDLPSRVSDFVCSPLDNGGVHTNNGPALQLYSLLSDGGTYNGVTYNSIGLLKAFHIFYQAKINYDYETETYSQYASHLYSACDDLIGHNLVDQYGASSGISITSTDCATVSTLTSELEFSTPPCTTYTFYGLFPPYFPETGALGTVAYVSACPSSTQYLKIGSQTVDASADTMYFVSGLSTAWSQQSVFSVPDWADTGLAYKTNIAYDFSSDTLLLNTPDYYDGVVATVGYFTQASIDSISPDSGSYQGGYTVTVSGANFQNLIGPCGSDLAEYDCLICAWFSESYSLFSIGYADFIDSETITCEVPEYTANTDVYLAISLNQYDVINDLKSFSFTDEDINSGGGSDGNSAASLTLMPLLIYLALSTILAAFTAQKVT